ncbi:MAG: hypothetical protein HEQ40_06945 [Lacibacter sp.]|jgi:hypothetical protein
MNLIKPSAPLLNNYQILLGNPVNWPFAAFGTYVRPTALDGRLNAYWQNYLTQFNAISPAVINRLPANPLEPHPYLNHPVYGQVDMTKKMAIVGTFPPHSYIKPPLNLPALPPMLTTNGLTRANAAYNIGTADMHFFYGNIGTLWGYVPTPPVPLTLLNCIAWLNQYDCTITDIIQFCQRENLSSPSDSNLFNIIPNYDLIEKLFDSSIETLLFTSGYPALNYLNNNSSFSIFIKTLNELGFSFGFGLFGRANNFPIVIGGTAINPIIGKGLFKLAYSDGIRKKELNIICLPSPSGQASRVMKHHPFYHEWSLVIPPAFLGENGWTNLFRGDIYELAFNQDLHSINLLQ